MPKKSSLMLKYTHPMSLKIHSICTPDSAMTFIHFKSTNTKVSISNITDIQLALDLIVVSMSRCGFPSTFTNQKLATL